MLKRILLIEDLKSYQLLVQASLGYKYEVEAVDTIEKARLRMKSHDFELFLVDVGLPDGSGIDFCREILSQEKSKDTPVILLTAKADVSDRVLGLSIGVDDYIVKPFDPSELAARIDLRIYKSDKKKSAEDFIKKGPFRFEISGLRLYISDNNIERDAEVTPIEFKILLKLVKNPNRVYSRQQLLDEVWGLQSCIVDRSIDKHISTIRKKISPYQDLIKTISGIGYEFKEH